MAFNENVPANNGYISDAPAEIRTNQKGLRDDAIVNAKLLQGLAPGNASGNIPVANGNVCVNLNSEKVGGKVPADFATAAHSHSAVTTSANGYMLNTDKIKIDSIQAGAEANQDTFANIKVGTTTIQADAKTDTLEIAAGANIGITPDATNDKITIAVTGTVPNATAAVSATTATTCTGNAATATKLATSRTIGLSGGVTGTATSFDGSGNITIPVTGLDVSTANAGTLPVTRGGTGATSLTGILKGNGTSSFTAATAGTDYAAASHGNHVPASQAANNTVFLRNDNTWQTITPANIGAAPVASPALTGTPTAPTAAAGTNTTQIATTAFVKTAAADSPLSVTASTQPAITATLYGSGKLLNQTTGVAAGSYSLKSIIQALVNISHAHTATTFSNCNCNCNTDN